VSGADEGDRGVSGEDQAYLLGVSVESSRRSGVQVEGAEVLGSTNRWKRQHAALAELVGPGSEQRPAFLGCHVIDPDRGLVAESLQRHGRPLSGFGL